MSGIVDHRICGLGEGPLWHPIREQLFWFDILGRRLLSMDATGPTEWRFPEMVSAAGWIGRSELLIASETALLRFNLETGASLKLCDLDADNPQTRSNDGRADPCGGFWIGTMGKRAEPGAGAIYRWYRGELRQLYSGLSIPNAICFSVSGQHAHFADTTTHRVMQVALDADGWPCADPTVFLDFTAEKGNPDGAVVDTDGVLWLAQWGASRVSAFDPSGRFVRAIAFDAPQTSCPAFGGASMSTLYCTSATQDMSPTAIADAPNSGKLFGAETDSRGQYEHQVMI